MVKYPDWILASISTRESVGIISAELSVGGNRDLGIDDFYSGFDGPSGMGILSKIGIPCSTTASCFMLDMESILSIFLMPSQCKMSGMSAWKRIYEELS